MTDSNIEVFNRLAEHWTAEIVSQIRQMEQTGQGLGVRGIETEIRQRLRVLGAQVLSWVLSQVEGTPAATQACACGGTLQYQRKRSAEVVSIFGRVSYRRGYYAGCACGHGQAPIDEQFGLQPGGVTAGLAELLALTGIELSFAGGADWLEKFLLFRVSETTVREETERFGALQAEVDEQQCRVGQSEDDLQALQRREAPTCPRLYGSLDAAKVRIEPRKPGEKAAPEREAWRDLKLGCWFEAEPVLPAQRSTRQRTKAERDQPALRATAIEYFTDIAPAEAFGQLLWGSGCQRQAERVGELIFVCDGAPWIWKLIDRYYPSAVQIVDWYHAADCLKRVAFAAFSREPDHATWLDQTLEQLWAGDVRKVIAACQSLAARSDEARRAVGYFTDNQQRMRYADFRALNYFIGSGTIESACKQIVAHRLKRSGAQWQLAGATQTAKARAAWLSGSWDALARQRDGLPLAA